MKTLADLSAPRDIQRKYLEKDIQKQCVDWARARDYWARKVSSPTQRSMPDYQFARLVRYFEQEFPRTVPVKFTTEFKAPGKTSTEAQLEEQKLMREAGWFVFECDNFDLFKQTVLQYEQLCIDANAR